jgi:hypothetical protein
LGQHGDVLVVDTAGHDNERMLPGELHGSSVYGTASNGLPLWRGGRSAAFGLRAKCDLVVLVVWPGASHWTATVCGAISRCRGERVVLNIAGRADAGTRPSQRVAHRALFALCERVVHGPAVDDSPTRPWTVLALCGDDIDLAHTMVSTINAVSDSVAHRWRLRLSVSPHAIAQFADGVRPDRNVTIDVETPLEAAIAGADVVLGSHGSVAVRRVEEAAASGAAGVIIGHPVAGRVVRRPDGVWLAASDPSSVVVALESATGAITDTPVSVEALRQAGDRVVAQVHALAY